MKTNRKLILALVGALALSTAAAPQLKQLIKVVGIGAAVKQFGPQINSTINKATKHEDTKASATKVVPILSVGSGSGAIGAAQVMGAKESVDKVQAVAQIEGGLFGEVRFRALIPVESKDVLSNIRRVDGVGVSGIVDLKL
ncbi:MAG: hypothetical protein M9921_02315 [Fimbriimonadaceae bacterium]|nr:hypothetical protein [Chthonomonadaceae bacterium]MCO5295668.1 hypothetical protein [Fimbriimonadaceae bacterium]